MASHYVVVQYVPDPVINERVNIGVIVFGDGILRSRFVDRWNRVSTFGGEQIGFLQGFAHAVSEEHRLGTTEAGSEWGEKLDEDLLRQIAGKWMNSIQFSEPRASLLPPEQLLDDMAARFLRRLQHVNRRLRDKRSAAALAADRLRAAISCRFGTQGAGFVKRHHVLRGECEQHTFDVCVERDQPYLAAQGLSFEIQDHRELTEQYQLAAWAIDDVKKRNATLPLAVVALGADPAMQEYICAQRVFHTLGATVITENQVDAWADRIAATVPL